MSARASSGPRRRGPPPRALLVLGLCFFGSAAVRLGDPSGAIAEEVSAMAAAATAPAGAQEDSAPPLGDAATDALLARVRERERELDAREAALVDRARVIEAAEAKLAATLAAVEEAEQRLSETVALADKAADADVARLVTVYETMNPKAAAQIFATMDIAFAAGFLSRMREEAAAEVLAGLDAERAYAISAVMAGRNARGPTE